jgi:hypothetical protein
MALLAFHPHFYRPDLPVTSATHAEAALAAAKAAGVARVRIGNIHLPGPPYDAPSESRALSPGAVPWSGGGM